ncbi:FimV C-terminal domain-containing protein [Pseudomonas sp. NFACC02]|uniref:FimV/HubP family polar landmark protein n=1 Tax=Pseudomonas TaxID=286 RepID=UPI0007825D36|nr:MULTISPECIES: FimV/HubP family polar landmark protein [Pseudomonas]SEQ75561.1 FimV C-terminal domain-containing protein [Pseudomonas sp. NFACC02]
MLKSFQAGRRRGCHAASRVQSGLRTGLLAVAVASAAMLHSTVAAALGLGEITLHSALGQPFNADIELIEAGGLTPEEIVVALAPAEAFTKAGVERVFFLNDLRFTPVIRGSRAVVHVESRKAVTEPYMDFVVRLVRPNGDQLREYTVLLDPPTSPTGLAATRSRAQSPASGEKNDVSRLPVAPPKAVQGKRYTVVSGDTLAGIARRMQAPGSKASGNELISGIQALNPQAFPNGERSQLKVGQVLLLPDSAIEPKPSVPATAGARPPTTAPGTAPLVPGAPAPASDAGQQLTATALENQQLAKTVDDLKAQVQQANEDEAGKDKQIIELQTQLAEMKALAARPAPAAVPAPAPASPSVEKTQPVATAPAPVQVPAAAPSVEDDELPWTTILAALLVLLLLLALAWSVRRNRIKNQLALQPEPAEPIIKPAQATVTPVFEVPAVTPRPVATAAPAAGTTAPAGQRLAGAATDALDGASIYIAYGRFAEALAILREALDKQPQRTDVRLRILELLGEQGDIAGFDAEEKVLLDQGIEAQKLEEIRSRYPKLKAVAAPVAPAPLAAESSVTPGLVAGAAVGAGIAAARDTPAGQLDENAAAALNPDPADDFQLNLDELSMDADWDLVDPFDSTPAPRTPAPEAPPALDPSFSSNLTELPEVFEMPEEQFLSDFAEEDETIDMDVQFEEEPKPVSIVQSNSDLMDDAFLDSFMTDDTEFDLMDLDEAPLSKINEAQVLIDEGNIEEARRLLQQVIDESDDGPRQTARDLLAGLG